MKPSSMFTISGEVRTADGMRGRLERVAVDPDSRVLTHLVVTPVGAREKSRLVPVDLVERAAPIIELTCTAEQFNRLEPAEEDEVLNPPEEIGTGGAMPSFGPGVGGGAHGGGPVMGPRAGAKPRVVTHEVVPDGGADVRKGEHAHALDGSIGKVKGLVADPETHDITHVLLNEGHLWAGKTVAVPISKVTSVNDGVQLDMTKRQVKDLPAVDDSSLASPSGSPDGDPACSDTM